MDAITISPDFVTFRIPRRANRWGRYTAHCFKGGRRYRAGDVDCGTDKDAAQAKAKQLIPALGKTGRTNE